MKALVIQIKMIGDVLASTVICESIKRYHPECEVHYLIQKNTAAVTQCNPHIDQLIYFDPNQHKGFANLYRLGKQLKKESYDWVIDAYGKWDSILPAYFSGAQKIVGHYKWYTTFFYTHTVIPDADCNATANAYRLLLSATAMGQEVTAIYPKIHLSPSEISTAQQSIRGVYKSDQKVIMVSVLGSGRTKSLPDAYMAEILDTIAAQPNMFLLLNYMPDQEEDVHTILKLCKTATVSKINRELYAHGLRDFIALVSQCDALVGNEGGATNMAKAVGTPTFTIYAPWINRTSWNIWEDTGLHEIVHLSDYEPELYTQHAKNYKSFALTWYQKLTPNRYREKLEAFLYRIKT